MLSFNVSLILMAKVMFSPVRDLLRRTQAASNDDPLLRGIFPCPVELCQVKPKQIDFLIINCSLRSGCRMVWTKYGFGQKMTIDDNSIGSFPEIALEQDAYMVVAGWF